MGLVEWPAVIQSNVVTHEPASTNDFLPTLADVFQITIPSHGGRSWNLDGVSLLPLFKSGDGRWSRPNPIGWIFPQVFPATRHSLQGVGWLEGEWKLVRDSHTCNLSAVPDCALALHNLTADPGEKRNVASSEPARLARMRSEMEAWLDDVYASRRDDTGCLKSDDAGNDGGTAAGRRVIRAWVSSGEEFWRQGGNLARVRKMGSILDGAFLFCKVGLNYSTLTVLDFNASECKAAAAAMRAIKPGFTVQGVLGLADCGVAQRINVAPQSFYASMLKHVQELELDGINLDWEACAFCDSVPGPSNCTPVGFGRQFGEMALGLARRLRDQRKNLSLAITTAVQADAFNGKMSQFIYAHELTRMLRDSDLIERVTSMDTYTNSYGAGANGDLSYFEKASRALLGALGKPLLGIGMAAYESPKQKDADQLAHGLRTLQTLGIEELDLFDVDAAKASPPDWWFGLLASWKNGSLA